MKVLCLTLPATSGAGAPLRPTRDQTARQRDGGSGFVAWKVRRLNIKRARDMTELAVKKIQVGSRIRKDLGDIRQLADSIREVD